MGDNRRSRGRVATLLSVVAAWLLALSGPGLPGQLEGTGVVVPTSDGNVSRWLIEPVRDYSRRPEECREPGASAYVLLVGLGAFREINLPGTERDVRFLEQVFDHLRGTAQNGFDGRVAAPASISVVSLLAPTRDEVLSEFGNLVNCASPDTTILVWWSGTVLTLSLPTAPSVRYPPPNLARESHKALIAEPTIPAADPVLLTESGRTVGWPCPFSAAIATVLQCGRLSETDPELASTFVLRDSVSILATAPDADFVPEWVNLHEQSDWDAIKRVFSLSNWPDDTSVAANPGPGFQGIRDADLAALVHAVRLAEADIIVGIDTNDAAALAVSEMQTKLTSWEAWQTPAGVTEARVPTGRALGDFAAVYASANGQSIADSPECAQEIELNSCTLSFAFGAALLAHPTGTIRELFEYAAALARYPEQSPLRPSALVEASSSETRLLRERIEPSGAAFVEIIEPVLTRGTLMTDERTLRLVGRVTEPISGRYLLVINQEQVRLTAGLQFTVELPVTPGQMVVDLLLVTEDLAPLSQRIEIQVGDALETANDGQRYALLIGNENYQDNLHYPDLPNPIDDVEALAEILTQQYGFTTTLRLANGEDLNLLLRDATGDDIEQAFVALRDNLTDRDTVLVYYAGHGIWEPATNFAAWVPVDARQGVRRSFFSAEDIEAYVLQLAARSVLVISDSCYAGQLTRAVPNFEVVPDGERRAALAEWWRETSRVFIAAGGNQPVLDGGGDGHSVFARALLTGLAEMPEDIFAAAELYQRFVFTPVSARADQEPRYQPYDQAGHVGGDFIFFRQSATPTVPQ